MLISLFNLSLTLAVPLVLACIASVLSGLLCWAVLRIALHRWPQLAAYRMPFLAAQMMAACAFAVALLPTAAPWRLLPAVTLDAPVHAAAEPVSVSPGLAAVEASIDDPAAGEKPVLVPQPRAAGDSWLFAVPAALALLYLAGLIWNAGRMLRAQLRWRRLRRASRLLGTKELLAHPGFTAQQVSSFAGQLEVRQSELALSPMLLGVIRPCLLLPSHMDCFEPAQQQMIVEHELTHWRRRDPAWQALASGLATVLWFNPALRWLQRQLGWAQELGCDRAVLAGKPQKQRQLYAAALVLQLKLQAWAGKQVLALSQAGRLDPVMAFGGGSMAARVSWMRMDQPACLGASVRLVLGLTFTAIAGASVVLQPALAWQQPAPHVLDIAAPAPVQIAAAAPEAWGYPLAKVRVTSFFGVASTLLPNGHRGIDFAAAKGTPVMATASGTVQSSSADERYGNYIVLEHPGGLRSLYAHLDSATVKTGAHVDAGQRIGTVGATGMATGPHLHLAAFRDGKLIDPQEVLAGLDSKATARALQRRNTAFGH